VPNIASLLKTEITRLARREIRQAVEPLRKQVTSQRRELTALKKDRDQLKRALAAVVRRSARGEQKSTEEGSERLRFSAAGFKSLRQKLGLSAGDMGRLAGVSGQSIYNWETGKARPRAAQLKTIQHLRTLGKRDARRLLDERG
jgi:DNA-binding transcriptional regulator YiaG